jgi:acyl-[acyl carrier protein]--UDP-N-acetylglucosamine O-acyltransferase
MTTTYQYNPTCLCDVCLNRGQLVTRDPAGSHCYDEPHIPARATNTLTGRDQTAVIGHAPEARHWRPGDPAWQPIIAPDARLEAYVTVDAGVKRPTHIGSSTWLMKHCHIGHDAIIGNHCELAPMTNIGGYAEIGDNVRIGMSAVILPFRKIGKDAHVEAGSVVTRDVPDGATVVGNPARILRPEERNPLPHSERNQ